MTEYMGAPTTIVWAAHLGDRYVKFAAAVMCVCAGADGAAGRGAGGRAWAI
jgi:hypothetical protein